MLSTNRTQIGNAMGCGRAKLRIALMLGCLSMLFTALRSRALAGDNGANPAATYTHVPAGSSPTRRAVTDTFPAR